MGYNFYLEVFKDKSYANKTEYFNSILSKNPFPDVEIEEFERLGQLHEIFSYLALNDIVIDEYS